MPGVIMGEKLKSRKLAVAVSLLLVSLASAFAGVVTWPEGLDCALKIGMSYLFAQGLPDVMKELAPVVAKIRAKK